LWSRRRAHSMARRSYETADSSRITGSRIMTPVSGQKNPGCGGSIAAISGAWKGSFCTGC
jgi:hypothetical protein